jgi:hypothetical protein
MTLCREQRLDFWVPHAGGVLGRLLSDMGRGAEGLAEAEGGLAIGSAMGTGFFRTYILGLTAEIQAGLGRLPEALETIDRALVLSGDHHDRAFEPELHRRQPAAGRKSERSRSPANLSAKEHTPRLCKTHSSHEYSSGLTGLDRQRAVVRW